ncbi:hypothetical protein SLEP1_g21333 [Rubroshorea leprosula]|uniref:TF-B3 domain-containing protein n=1 Tax=Rubroshorea leprosula TaxID=152421 RepID=A0AAV5JEQ8_9ROSI|nr:hypothetical protein SLEP1_g21333 [Rubroshorea leprosula]
MALVSTQTLPYYSTSTGGKLTFPKHVVGKIGMLFHPKLQNERKAELKVFLEVPKEGSRPFEVTASLQKEGNGDRVVLLASGWKPIVRELQLKEGDTVSIFLLNNTEWTYLMAVTRAPEAKRVDEDVVPEEAPIRMEFDLNQPVQVQLEMEINLNQPNQPVCMEFDLNEPAYPHMEMDEDVVPEEAPIRMAFDLNQPVQLGMEINLNQLNPPVRMKFDLNEPAPAHMEMDEDVVPEEAPMRMEFDLNQPVQLDMENNLNQPNQPVRMEFDLNEPSPAHMEINLNDEE